MFSISLVSGSSKTQKSPDLSRGYHRPLQSDIYDSRNLLFKSVSIHNPYGLTVNGRDILISIP
nr:MAG TPA: hypothetical protein [Caudoviricetes sp.]